MNSEQEKDRQEAKKGQLSPEGNKVKRAKETVAKRSDDEITDEEQRQMQAREEYDEKEADYWYEMGKESARSEMAEDDDVNK